jgi:hypothetical protein
MPLTEREPLTRLSDPGRAPQERWLEVVVPFIVDEDIGREGGHLLLRNPHDVYGFGAKPAGIGDLKRDGLSGLAGPRC